MENKKKGNYLSIKESRAIIKYNIKQMKYYEALKKKKLSPEEYTSVMKDPNNIVEIDNLQTNFFTDNGTVKSVNGVSFNIPKNKIVGVVGESGCGKSVTSLSIMQLVQSPQGQVVGGEIRFNSDDLGTDENGNKLRCAKKDFEGKKDKNHSRVVSYQPTFQGLSLGTTVSLHFINDTKNSYKKAKRDFEEQLILEQGQFEDWEEITEGGVVEI